MAGNMRLVAKPDTWELRVFIGRDPLKGQAPLCPPSRHEATGSARAHPALIEQEDKPAQPIELMAPARIEGGPGYGGLSVPRCLATATIVASD